MLERLIFYIKFFHKVINRQKSILIIDFKIKFIQSPHFCLLGLDFIIIYPVKLLRKLEILWRVDIAD